MNKEETNGLLLMVKGNYPNAYKDADQVQFNILVNSWHGFFADIPVEIMVKVVQKHILNNEYPPTVKGLREEALKIMQPNGFLSPLEAWEIVDRAVSRFGWSNERKALDSFPEPVQRAVRNIGGWQKICSTPLGQEWDFLRKNFINAYEEFGQEDQTQYLMPKGMLTKLQSMAEQKHLEHRRNELPEV